MTAFRRALLVEDELNLAQALKIAVDKLKIPLEHVTTLEAARQSLGNSPAPDLLILDRALPDGDGIQLCTELRSRGFSGSILLLTAYSETSDKVQGLNAGADDYLGKPFSWEELEARIRALSRRRQTPESAVPSAAHSIWEMNSGKLSILGPLGWIVLTPLEFKLAVRLIHSEGSIVSRSELLKDVWGFTLLPKTRTVDHFLGRLRKYFETNPDEPRHFKTVRGAGYVFER